MIVAVSELTGAALDWAVAKCEGWIKGDIAHPQFCRLWKYEVRTPTIYPSSDWTQGGSIIERERITLRVCTAKNTAWVAFYDEPGGQVKARQRGPTPLIAAMRSYVESKMGSVVTIPDSLK